MQLCWDVKLSPRGCVEATVLYLRVLPPAYPVVL